jgi:hypothetical protein
MNRLPPILAQAVETTVREYTWINPIPAWVIFLVLLPVLVAFAVFIYRRELPRGPRPLGWVLSGLRVLALLAIIALLAGPVLRTTRYENLDATIIVLADVSLSMDVADKYANREALQKIADGLRTSPEQVESTTRYDLVARLFRDPEANLLEKLRTKGKVAVYGFAGSIAKLRDFAKRKDGDPPLGEADRDLLPPYERFRPEERARETRIADALLDALAAERGGGFRGGEGRVAAVLLFSDGQQTPGARPLEDVARRLGQRDIPVYAVGVGNPDEPKDIRVIHLDVNDIVLAGDLVPADAAIVADGFAGERVRVDLKLDNEVVDTEFVLLEGGGRRQPVRLQFRPPRPGDFVATVEVEHQSGELFSENNAASKPIKVLDQKIRVLYVEGRPRWEYRYLKNALIRDATMEAQIYLVSADPSFVQESSPGVPPLASIPRTREEIFAYHVLILGDVDLEKHVPRETITLLKDFVYEAGGGIVFVAGDNANPWKYVETDLYGLIPVEVPEKHPLGTDVPPITTAFNVELTPAGKEHVVMRLDNDAGRNAKLWENKDGQPLEHLPGFYWFADVGRPKKAAIVLAQHPARTHPIDGKGLPVLAFMNYGKGRTFFSGIDETWRWRAGIDNQYFYRFWGQVIRFAATGRLLGKTPRFGITTDKLTYNLGETVNLEGRVFDAEMKPSTEKTLTVYHQARTPDVDRPETLELGLDPVQGQGTYHGALVASRLGLHDLWIGTETERLAFRSFDVAVPALELRDPRKNRTLLETAARLSGGAYVELEDAAQAVDRIQGESRSQQGDVEDEPLWDETWVLLAFTGLIALEWMLRKLAHLV